MVEEYATLNPQQLDNRYGSQRRRANLPLKRTSGRLMTDPPIIRSKSFGERREPMKFFINGEKLSARQASEKNPKLKISLTRKRT